MLWSATSKLKLAFPHVLMKLLMYQTKIHVRRLHRAYYHPSWSQQMTSDKTEKFKEKAFLSRKKNASRHQALFSQQAFSSSNPPAYLHEENKLYKQNVTIDEASLSSRALQHFIESCVRTRAACCCSLTCDINTPPPWSRSRTQCHHTTPMLGRARGTQQRCW